MTAFDEHYAGMFKLVKPRTSDVETLLGHRGTSPQETLAEVF